VPSSKRQKVADGIIFCSNDEAVEKMRCTPVSSFATASLFEQRSGQANNILCFNDEAVEKMRHTPVSSSISKASLFDRGVVKHTISSV
jgi:hypothetical protein